MIVTLSNAFMTASRMDAFSYNRAPVGRLRPVRGGLLRRLRALLWGPDGCRA